MKSHFDWKGLAEALTYAHCEDLGIEVTRSVSGNGVGGTESAVGKVGLGEGHDSTCLQGKCGHKSDTSSRSESQQNCAGLGAEWGIPPADSSILPTAQVHPCSQLPSNLGHADSANGAVAQAAPEKFGAIAQGKTGERTSPAEQEPSKLRVDGSNPSSPSPIQFAPQVPGQGEGRFLRSGQAARSTDAVDGPVSDSIHQGTTIIEMEQLVERISAEISPLQVAKLANGMSLERLNFEMKVQPNNDGLGGYHDPAEDPRFA